MTPAVAIVMLAKVPDLESMSIAGNPGFLIIGMDNLVGYKLSKKPVENKINPAMIGF